MSTSSKPHSRIHATICARAGAVRLGEVGHGELAALGVAGVAVLRELLAPVPDLVAERGLDAELVVQADLGDAVDVAQALGEFEVRVVGAGGARRSSMISARVRPAPRGPRTARMKGKPNFGVVVGVELLDAARTPRACSAVRPAPALLVGRLGGERRRSPSPCRPARGGRGSARAARRGAASRTACTSACFSCGQRARTAAARSARSAIHGECS